MDAKSQAIDLDLRLIEAAVQSLRAGDLVAFPTETVYGLGANACSEYAMRRLFKAKGRPNDHPVIVHLAEFGQVFDWASDVPETAKILAKSFWPGPLTMILKRSSKASDLVTGGQDTIGLRIPNHPIALTLLKAFGDGIAAPSANRFGRVSPTSAQDVKNDFGKEVAFVLDGGNCQVGIESTIVDLSKGKAEILRPGMISAHDLDALLGANRLAGISDELPATRVPGSLAKHYSTQTPLKLKNISEIVSTVRSSPLGSDEQPHSIAVLSFQDKPDKAKGLVSKWIKASTDMDEYARSLYRNLRELDQSRARVILVEEPPETWLAVRDRLSRASGCAQ